jgi:hypothetical protein
MPERTQGHQGFQTGLDLHEDMASSATITTIWPTTGNVFFPTETDASVAAVTGAGKNFQLIYKQACLGGLQKKPLMQRLI